MISELRARHRATITALVLVLPAAFVAAILARPAAPVGDLSWLGPWGDAAAPAPSGLVISLEWKHHAIETGLSNPEKDLLVLDMLPLEELPSPDLLVYLAAAMDYESEAESVLPDGALLLGALDGRGLHRFSIRADEPGYPETKEILLLYSLAHQRVVDRSYGNAIFPRRD